MGDREKKGLGGEGIRDQGLGIREKKGSGRRGIGEKGTGEGNGRRELSEWLEGIGS